MKNDLVLKKNCEWKYTIYLLTKVKCLMKPIETMKKMIKDVLFLKELFNFENTYCNDNLEIYLKICNLYNKYIQNIDIQDSKYLFIKLLKLNNSIIVNNDEKWNYFNIYNNTLLEQNLQIVKVKLEFNINISYKILCDKLLPLFLESNIFKNIIFNLYYYELNNPNYDSNLQFKTCGYNIKYNNNKTYWLELFKNVAESISDISLLVCDMQQKHQPIIFMNEKEFNIMTGYSNKDLGKKPSFLQCSQTNIQDIQNIKEAIKNKSKLNINILNQKMNGDLFWMHLSLIPILDENKNMIYSIGIQLDLNRDLNYINDRVYKLNIFLKNLPSSILSNKLEDYNLFYYSLKDKVKSHLFSDSSNIVLINYIKLWCNKLNNSVLKEFFKYASDLYINYKNYKFTSNIILNNNTDNTDNINKIHAYYIALNITNTNIYNFKISLNKTKKNLFKLYCYNNDIEFLKFLFYLFRKLENISIKKINFSIIKEFLNKQINYDIKKHKSESEVTFKIQTESESEVEPEPEPEPEPEHELEAQLELQFRNQQKQTKVIKDNVFQNKYDILNHIKSDELFKNHHLTQNNYKSIISYYKISKTQKKNIENILDYNINSNTIVKKEYSKDINTTIVKGIQYREYDALKKLYKKKHFPIILSKLNNSDSILMSYCGVNINNNNIPKNWKIQINEIVNILDNLKIYHNNIWKNNFLIHKNVINLIDFGWSSKKKEYPYQNIKNTYINNNTDFITLLGEVYIQSFNNNK